MPDIAILTDETGWHVDELQTALAKHGYSSACISPMQCHFNLTKRGEVVLPGFRSTPPAIFVRGIPGGTLEQIVYRLNIIHTLAENGVLIYNNSRGIERTVDKAMTSILLKKAGLPTPETWVCESRKYAELICRQAHQQGKDIILKPLFGSQGIGIHRIRKNEALIHDEKFAGVYYLQTFIDCGDRTPFDIRVFVINNTAQAAMTRHSKTWLTNRSQGATCQHLPLDKTLCELAEAAIKAVDIEYGGVDLIMDASGQLHVIEVNSIPSWYGLQKVTEQNIAEVLIDDLINHLQPKQSLCHLPFNHKLQKTL